MTNYRLTTHGFCADLMSDHVSFLIALLRAAPDPLNQIIEVAGQRIRYSAFRLPDGTINVGRIHGVP